MRLAVTAGCAAVLTVAQVTQAQAKTRVVSFNYRHLWVAPEITTTAKAPISFTIRRCDHPHSDMTVLLRDTDGINQDMASETIKCRAGQKATFRFFGKGYAPSTYEVELGKLDDGKSFRGSGFYTFK